MRKFLIIFCAVGALVCFTKAVWQSGFDQGVNVALCTMESFRRGGDIIRLAKDDPACVRAKAGKRNPLWLLRRKNGQ